MDQFFKEKDFAKLIENHVEKVEVDQEAKKLKQKEDEDKRAREIEDLRKKSDEDNKSFWNRVYITAVCAVVFAVYYYIKK